MNEPGVPKLDDVFKLEAEAGIHDRNNLALRVRWVGALREIVGKTVPANKVGSPLVTDIDLLCATADQRLEAYPDQRLEAYHKTCSARPLRS